MNTAIIEDSKRKYREWEVLLRESGHGELEKYIEAFVKNALTVKIFRGMEIVDIDIVVKETGMLLGDGLALIQVLRYVKDDEKISTQKTNSTRRVTVKKRIGNIEDEKEGTDRNIERQRKESDQKKEITIQKGKKSQEKNGEDKKKSQNEDIEYIDNLTDTYKAGIDDIMIVCNIY